MAILRSLLARGTLRPAWSTPSAAASSSTVVWSNATNPSSSAAAAAAAASSTVVWSSATDPSSSSTASSSMVVWSGATNPSAAASSSRRYREILAAPVSYHFYTAADTSYRRAYSFSPYPFAAVAVLGGCVGGVMTATGGLGTSIEGPGYHPAEAVERGISADVFLYDENEVLRGIHDHEMENTEPIVIVACPPPHRNLQALYHRIYCPLSHFKYFMKYKIYYPLLELKYLIKKNIRKLPLVIPDMLLHLVKMTANFLLETVKEEILGRAKRIVVTWIISMSSCSLGYEMAKTSEQLEDIKLEALRNDIVLDIKREIVSVLSDHEDRISLVEMAKVAVAKVEGKEEGEVGKGEKGEEDGGAKACKIVEGEEDGGAKAVKVVEGKAAE